MFLKELERVNKMKRFEYFFQQLCDVEYFNQLGESGWELVCFDDHCFIFKKEIVEE
jgi:hypothetical protein